MSFELAQASTSSTSVDNPPLGQYKKMASYAPSTSKGHPQRPGTANLASYQRGEGEF